MLQAQTGNAGIPVVVNPGWGFVTTAIISLTAGTMFVMWLGEQITERGLGNGISLLIFAGIVATLPGAIASTLAGVGEGTVEPLTLIILAFVIFGTIAFVVFMEKGQRRITVNYARRSGTRTAFRNDSSHLPLKINMSGVIPAVFASSFIMFPATILQFMGADQANSVTWLTRAAAMLSPGQPIYMLVEAFLIIGFAFFYTALVFNSQETADNLKKSNALIPGIRPGKATAEYIDGVMTRLTMIGGLYLTAVCLLPHILQNSMNLSFFFGGTSLLIVVVVVMDTFAQIQTHLVSHQYESVMKKSNLKSGNRQSLFK
jgi:preprotein translocase subunit SecY